MIVEIHTQMANPARSWLHLTTRMRLKLALIVHVISVDLLLVIDYALNRHMQLDLTCRHPLLLLYLLLDLPEMVDLSLLNRLFLLDSHLLCLSFVLLEHLLLQFLMLPLLMLSFFPRFHLQFNGLSQLSLLN